MSQVKTSDYQFVAIALSRHGEYLINRLARTIYPVSVSDYKFQRDDAELIALIRERAVCEEEIRKHIRICLVYPGVRWSIATNLGSHESLIQHISDDELKQLGLVERPRTMRISYE